MIFNNLNEFSEDLKMKILDFVSDKCYEHNIILAIIKSYLHEVQNINEIINFKINFKNNTFLLYIESTTEKLTFNVNITSEQRKRKIKKLKKEQYILHY